jgi:HAD superfamily hydrolase (TIGR01549 family)
MNESAAQQMAVIWDFDGTLVDSHPKNLSVNREIVQRITGREHSTFAALSSTEAYEQAVARSGNWRDFYAREFGFTEDDMHRAGELWPELQLADPTPHLPFDGIPEALDTMVGVPHAILSQNDSRVVRQALDRAGLMKSFVSVFGHGELDRRDQKPAGGGLLRCIRSLGLAGDARVFFVGDHVTDAMAARNARSLLNGDSGRHPEIVSVGALFGATKDMRWSVAPDHFVRTPPELVRLVQNGQAG